jgi:hypothetical protein
MFGEEIHGRRPDFEEKADSGIIVKRSSFHLITIFI